MGVGRHDVDLFVAGRDDESRARDARTAAGADVAAAAAEAVASGASTEIALQAGETASAMLQAARVAAVAAARTAALTAQAAAEVAAQNVSEVALEAAVTAAAMITAATNAAQELAVAGRTTDQVSATEVAMDVTIRAAATADAMLAAADAAAVRAAERSRHDANTAADVAARAIADIVSEAAATAAAMVVAAAAAVPVAAIRASELARHEAHAQGQADMLSAVIDGITDSVEVVDEYGCLLMHNRAAGALGVQHGRNTLDRPGQGFGLFQPDGITPFPLPDTPVVRALAGESSDSVIMLSRNAAHPYGVLIAVNGRPLRDASGRPGAVLVSRDVTAESAQRTELEMFAAVAAHDLRNPLAIVSGYLDLVADIAVPELTGATADAVVDVLGRAQGGTARMEHLIDDLLNYATRDAALILEDVDLSAKVNDIIADLTGALSEGMPPAAFFVGPLPWVRGDQVRIYQVLYNVISNALKYTAPGESARIDITAHQTVAGSSGGPRVHVQVTDRGIGIPPGEHVAIFTSFHRADTPSPYSGSGLGLAICQRIIERHGGHIYATDNPGGGTCMHFSLPAIDPVDHPR